MDNLKLRYGNVYIEKNDSEKFEFEWTVSRYGDTDYYTSLNYSFGELFDMFQNWKKFIDEMSKQEIEKLKQDINELKAKTVPQLEYKIRRLEEEKATLVKALSITKEKITEIYNEADGKKG
jgi:hypothetical protein